jgi:hypothetical protein
MSAKTHRNVAIRFISTATEHELLEQLDQLLQAATDGDGHAVAAIAVAFGPKLLSEARRELGPLFAHDAFDVLHDFLTALMAGGLQCPPIRGGALPWMRRMMRLLARHHLAMRAGEGGAAA